MQPQGPIVQPQGIVVQQQAPIQQGRVISAPQTGTVISAPQTGTVVQGQPVMQQPLLGGVRAPDRVQLAPQVYFDGGAWRNRDTAYMQTPSNHHLRFPFQFTGEDIFSVGCHNNLSTYSFTSVESCVQNALHWANRHLGSDEPIRVAWTANAAAAAVVAGLLVLGATLLWSSGLLPGPATSGL